MPFRCGLHPKIYFSIIQTLFSRLPAYKVAVFVESRLANFEKDRPRSSFPHLYVTLAHAIADTIVTSLIGSTAQYTSDDMLASTAKLLKWISAVGFASVSNYVEHVSFSLRSTFIFPCSLFIS
jgi:hypothetical protein